MKRASRAAGVPRFILLGLGVIIALLGVALAVGGVKLASLGARCTS